MSDDDRRSGSGASAVAASGTLFVADDDDAEGKLVLVAALLIAIALCGSVFTTIAIVRSTARKYATGVITDHGFAKQDARA